jgi:hypothetical protein
MQAHASTPNGGEGATLSPVISIPKFCHETGISPVTAWRMRQKGWLQTVNICGRQYVTAESLQDFKRRAVSGEFAKQHKVPAAPNAKGGSR